MHTPGNEASLWRVDLARELSGYYSPHPMIAMICLGGSAARGIADIWSDLDIIVYWKGIDTGWLRKPPLPVERTAASFHDSGTVLESYHLQGLKADFGHVSLEDWEEWVKPLFSTPEPDLEAMGSVGGFLSSIVFHGEAEYLRIRNRISSYPDSLAVHAAGKGMGFFVKDYLEKQCLERGDLIAWHQGALQTITNIVNVLAAVNRVWFHAGELRWLGYHLGKMSLLPQGFSAENIERILKEPGRESSELLYRFQQDTLSLVEREIPELKGTVEKKRERIEALRVTPCSTRPSISPGV
jgi:hypothetical protein